MVKVEVITEQIDEKHLDAATEKRIRKLLGNAKTISQQQASILQSIIDGAILNAAKILTNTEAMLFSSVNIFADSTAMEKLIPYDNNIGKMFKFGIQFSTKAPSSTVSKLEEAVRQSSRQYITKMGESLKRKAGDIVAEGIRKQTPTNQIVNQLKDELNITRARANTIARTETMRAAHAGSYAQARRDGKRFFIIDSRAEACRICKRKYSGVIFNIDESNMLPPLHPNCACIPIYFNDIERAQRWRTKIDKEIAAQVNRIEESGKIIKPDGTGTEVSKLKPEERIKN